MHNQQWPVSCISKICNIKTTVLTQTLTWSEHQWHDFKKNSIERLVIHGNENNKVIKWGCTVKIDILKYKSQSPKYCAQLE